MTNFETACLYFASFCNVLKKAFSVYLFQASIYAMLIKKISQPSNEQRQFSHFPNHSSIYLLDYSNPEKVSAITN